MIASLVFSLTQYDVINPPKFIGLGNWTAMFAGDPLFWHSLKVTLSFAVVALPLGLVFGLALAWGIAYALALEKVAFLRWLVDKRTWITVVIGVGVDLALAFFIVPFEWWWRVALVVVLSAMGIIARSIYLERAEWQELMRTVTRGELGERRRYAEDCDEAFGEQGDLES